MNFLEKYYNKFNEDKRLISRHGQVEFFVTTKYILDFLENKKNLNIIDICAGTGRYSALLSSMGHNVTAVDLVQKNVSQIKQKDDKIKAFKGNALKLKFEDNAFDVALLFGATYHLFSQEERLKAINEAKRVVKEGGLIFVMYLMNEYAVVTHAFKEGKLQESLQKGKLDKNFKCMTNEDDLFSFVRLEDINFLAQKSLLKREKIIAVDGPTDYIRPYLNSMTKEDFDIFIQYQLSICERPELLGASSHVLDILRK